MCPDQTVNHVTGSDPVEGDGAMRHSTKCARKLEEGRVDSIALSTVIWNDDSRGSQCGRKAYLFSTGYRSGAGTWQAVPLTNTVKFSSAQADVITNIKGDVVTVIVK
jgi:hypothetical protein